MLRPQVRQSETGILHFISAHVHRASNNAREYFEEHLCVGDYYDEGQRVAGEWLGLGAQMVLGRVLGWFTWLRILWVDGGYTGETFAQGVKGLRPKLAVEVVKRSDDTAGFKVLPRRWVVERTFGWLMRQRRLVRDCETTVTSAEAWIYIAMIRIQLRRLA